MVPWPFGPANPTRRLRFPCGYFAGFCDVVVGGSRPADADSAQPASKPLGASSDLETPLGVLPLSDLVCSRDGTTRFPVSRRFGLLLSDLPSRSGTLLAFPVRTDSLRRAIQGLRPTLGLLGLTLGPKSFGRGSMSSLRFGHLTVLVRAKPHLSGLGPKPLP